MLTLTRKPHEVIHIGDNIKIVVKKISNGVVHIGIKAPAETFIYRGELYQKIQKRKSKTAADADKEDRKGAK